MEQKKSSSQCIGIVGLGLIGGSLGLDLQSLGFKVHGLVNRSITAEIIIVFNIVPIPGFCFNGIHKNKTLMLVIKVVIPIV